MASVNGRSNNGGVQLIDSELAAAVAAADALANPTVPQVIDHPEWFNGTTWDRLRNNNELTLLASAARTADTTSSDTTNYNWRGGHFIINITVLTTSVIPTIQAKDPISGTYYSLLVGASIAATGITILKVYPGITAVANASASDILPRTFRISMDHLDATTMTYSVAFVGVL